MIGDPHHPSAFLGVAAGLTAALLSAVSYLVSRHHGSAGRVDAPAVRGPAGDQDGLGARGRGVMAVMLGGVLSHAGWHELEERIDRQTLLRRIAAAAFMTAAIAIYVFDIA